MTDLTDTQTKTSSDGIFHQRGKEAQYTSLFVYLFVLALVFPFQIYVGTIRLSPYRIFLIISLIPCLLMWLGGRAGKKRASDFIFIIFTLWVSMTFFLHHDFNRAFEASGIFAIETLGAYFLARCLIRTPEDCRSFVRFMFIIILVILPFCIMENITGRHLINETLQRILPVHPPHYMEPRLGLHRAFGPLAHPILLGVFCASVFALSFYVLGYGRSMLRRITLAGVVAVAGFTSLSAGPLVAIVVQTGLIIWDYTTRFLKSRWLILFLLFVAAYIVVDIISNRTPPEVFISYLTFNVGNSYNRVLIWRYGTAEVLRHPFFGIGFHEWARAWHMSTSMDNHWLVVAVRHGLPGFLMYAGAILLILRGLGQVRDVDSATSEYRKGYLITLVGLVVVGGTVHYWNAIYVLFLFLIGSSVWVLDRPKRAETKQDDASAMTPRPAENKAAALTKRFRIK